MNKKFYLKAFSEAEKAFTGGNISATWPRCSKGIAPHYQTAVLNGNRGKRCSLDEVEMEKIL
jgi:hypothetical protein